MTDTLTQNPDAALQTRAINAIRALTIDATEATGDGHPGMPMGTAAMAYALWSKFLRHNPHNPSWFNRDRFVQSAGHGSMLIYSLLHLTGYDLPMVELKRYRQWGSKTPGHPEYGHTPGVETTTGPLGQGISTAVGMALAEAHLAARYNRPGFEIIDHYTYVIASDGDLMEGVSAEASSLAGHLGLGKLIVLYDDNQITIDGKTEITFSEDVLKRYQAYGWQTERVEDGNEVAAISAAIARARADTERPSLIAVRTVIGYGSPNKAGTSAAHGSVLGAEEAKRTKENLGIDWPAFSVPEEVLAHYRQAVSAGTTAEQAWWEKLRGYQVAHPELATELQRAIAGEVPEVSDLLPRFAVGGKDATRNSSHQVLNALAGRVSALVGGSADLAGSNKTTLKGGGFMQRGDYAGRNIHFGVREHGMGAIANGLALHGGVVPYVATFLIFSDYLRPSLRLAALMGVKVIYLFTHDSIGLGGDGPTHQPVEHLMSLRAIPNLLVLRPADANETAQAWEVALHQSGPVVLALSRQDLPHLAIPQDAVAKGAYTLSDSSGPLRLVLVATGSEVSLALAAQAALLREGIGARVVSMPSWELFDRQEAAYRTAVLPNGVPRLALEAGASFGWHKYLGSRGTVIGVDRFGASAPGEEAMAHYGFSVERVVQAAKELLG